MVNLQSNTWASALALGIYVENHLPSALALGIYVENHLRLGLPMVLRMKGMGKGVLSLQVGQQNPLINYYDGFQLVTMSHISFAQRRLRSSGGSSVLR